MKEILIARTHATVYVDDEDFNYLSQFRWEMAQGGYAFRRFTQDGKPGKILMHREIMNLKKGDPHVVDHKNGDGLDNRRCNLVVCTHSENQQNRQGSNRLYGGRPVASRYRGVFKSGKKWAAKVRIENQVYYLGSFDDEEEAAKSAENFRFEKEVKRVERRKAKSSDASKITVARPTGNGRARQSRSKRGGNSS